MTTYATVTPIPPVPALGALTYRVPDALGATVVSGVRVVVPLGRRRVTGIVTGLGAVAPAGVACRDIGEVLDAEPVLNDELLALARWMSDYYLAPLADVVSLAVTRGLTGSSKRVVALADPDLARTSGERAIVDVLARERGGIDTVRLRRLLPGRSLETALSTLAARGAVTVDERFEPPKVRARHERIVVLKTVADETMAASLFTRAPKRRQIYEYLLGKPGRSASLRELAELFPAPAEQVAAMERAGLIERVEQEVYRSLSLPCEDAGALVLSEPQAEAVEAVIGSLGAFAPFLLQGVTASGKTEVYLRVIAQVLERGGGALVLVPEISLTHQVVARLVGRFGPTVAVIHSELSAGERWDEWRRIRRRQARIAVGARSAVLAPLDDLGVVIVDEEHDGAYKQDDGVRYNGRDVAVVRARLAGCPVVLGSATPSIESRHRAAEQRYRHIVLPERVTASALPSVEVVDLRGRDIHATGGLSDHLARLVKENFERGGQTLLFINRRGYAASLQCYGCGEIVECSACSVGMTVHHDKHRLCCHHCGAARALPVRCPACQTDALVSQGLGTQRLESNVRALLPEARIARLDRDTAARKGTSGALLADWRAGRIDVLVGTQMIAKGHDAPGVTLVGIVQADLGLAVPDFRAAERTFQLLSQVAGRAGRGAVRGRVILQTYRPDHFAVATAVRHDYETFAACELGEREELGYPPFARMVLLRFESKSRADAEGCALAAARVCVRLARATPPAEAGDGLEVRGPAPSPLERIKDRYRFQVQLRSRGAALVRHAAAECRRILAEEARRKRVRLSVDVDPVDML